MANTALNVHFSEDFINLIEPHNADINTKIVNGIPQYQDMHIFAELTAVRKARTVLVQVEKDNFQVEKTGLETTVSVSFLGSNQNKGISLADKTITNPNYLNFTTNYYQGSAGGDVQYEGFGITDIKVVINSSFVPQVNIQFVDIRGLAFFNQQNSPYRILFDFPPPIFDLTIKGYYGKALTYRLHLVKYTSEFKSENGNFVIDAQFIAVTYAPLTDVLFRYAINFPRMKRNLGDKSLTSAPNTKPRNTDELIKKIRALIPAIADIRDSSEESEKFSKANKQLQDNKSILEILNGFNTELTDNPFLLMYDTSGENTITPTSKILAMNSFSNYDTYIQKYITENEPTEILQRLYIVYYSGPVPAQESKYDTNTENQIKKLNEYRTKIIDRIKANEYSVQFDDNDIEQAKTITDTYDYAKNVDFNPNKIKYVGLDITKLYVKLQKNIYSLNNDRMNAGLAMNDKINEIVYENLGMLPTIYNIFKIILDDVDVFFETIRNTSKLAEVHHNKKDYYTIITGDINQYADSMQLNKVFAFPLIINKTKVCGGYKSERVAPFELDKRLPAGNGFPELELIYEFIDSFYLQDFNQNLNRLKEEKNEDGTNIWIPISPIDSQLASRNVQTPYIDVEGIGGENEKDDFLSKVFRIVLNRFYIFAQYAFSSSIYGGEDANVRRIYLETYGQSEGINLAASITTPKNRNVLRKFAQDINGNVDSFYTYLKNSKTLSDVYNFNGESIKLSSSDNAYVDKYNPEFNGIYIIPETRAVNLQLDDDDKETKNPVQKFVNELQKDRTFDFLNYSERFYRFTQENAIYVEDIWRRQRGRKRDEEKNSMDVANGICLHTRFLSSRTRTIDEDKANILLERGNMGFGWGSPSSGLKSFDNIIDVWVKQLKDYDDIIYPVITGSYSTRFKALMFLSNFGYTLGPFNVYPKLLGLDVFQTPAIVQIPKFFPAYIGALIGMDEDETFINELKDFFINGAGKNMDNNGLYIFADIHDVNYFLSENDKERFKDEYDEFLVDEFDDFVEMFDELYNKVVSGVTTGSKKEKLYNAYLNPMDSDSPLYYSDLILPLIKRISMAVYSQTTFNTKAKETSPLTYQSLSYTNGAGGQYNKNASFFRSFFAKLFETLGEKDDEVKKEEERIKEIKGDKDIVTQTYYSLKNINDKWLVNPENMDVYGYPFNETGNRLIDSFVFVDRAMNPIGDTIINPEALLEMYEDSNLSVFGVISSLLSSNGFEFFPLQNFMKYEEGEWQECFKIDTAPIKWSKPAFVCMYIGGSSSYPSNMNNNGFEDDGIIDLSSAPDDFSTGNCERPLNDDLDNQMNKYPDFPWREVRAFRVRFGEQNQSMFTGIKIDTKEFPETNESINILSKLAGDGGAGAPIPKGQNLYNTYENRAYGATVTAMGNATIQPTQYFQIENVPMFNGAYLILTVEHTITPNKMMTNFSGTKILRFPFPRVLNPAAIWGVDINLNEMSPFNVLKLTQAISMSHERLEKLNSVFGIDISHWQEGIDWSKVSTPATPDEPQPKFALIKSSQGPSSDSRNPNGYKYKSSKTQADGAHSAGMKITYYHYAEQYSGSDPETDAKAQAKFFLDTVATLPKPDSKYLVLDIETYEKVDENGNIVYRIFWSKNKANNDKWIQTFVKELSNKGYKTILYSGKPWLDEFTSADFSSLPLWHSQYPSIPNSPEIVDPTINKNWVGKGDGWAIWQFSSQGRINGYNGRLDINAMRKDFFNKNFA